MRVFVRISKVNDTLARDVFELKARLTAKTQDAESLQLTVDHLQTHNTQLQVCIPQQLSSVLILNLVFINVESGVLFWLV